MRHILAAFALAAAALTAPTAPARADDAPEAKLVTVIATAEPQTQMMALVLTMASRQQGAEVRVMLCGPGGDLALLDPPASALAPQQPRGMSPHGLLTRLIEAGVTVEVCAIYLPNREGGPEILMEGVGVAMPPAIAAAMLADDTRLLTF